ncbi:MAG: 2-isopropylmalate synthase [Clostridia bacterium]|nr:2-isopropylmalate synthase [Clostridia bacterium]
MDATKYAAGYYLPPKQCLAWTKKDKPDHAPVWCSVDMRDGNQSLVVPMDLEEKLEFFKTLVKVGFKEIEVGFPAASETEYEFVRAIIERGLIPDDVTIQVLTQCREHIIKKTFEAIKGAKNAIVHFYNSVSVVQREQVFKKSKAEVKKIAVDGAKLVKSLASTFDGNLRYEYSPESFTGAEPEYAVEVINAVLDVLEPNKDNVVVVNLPVTVEMSLPHVYASQVEYVCGAIKYREYVSISVHPHNDRGTGVADAELALLAGADRIEGTLFGNGERTGNVDIVTLALNLYSHGIDPKLDLSDLPNLVETYERCTGMRVHERAPYAGALVYAAFSGSHQDAIAKGLRYREERGLHRWTVPYIPIDPTDVSRTYDADVIRLNSQSGKGGVGYVMERKFGYVLPDGMREALSYACKDISDRDHRELKPEEVLAVFKERFFLRDPIVSVTRTRFVRSEEGLTADVFFKRGDSVTETTALGNGSLDAVSNALKQYSGKNYKLEVYSEHSMSGSGSRSVAAAYIGIRRDDGKIFWGVGTDTDIVHAGVEALLSAYDKAFEK